MTSHNIPNTCKEKDSFTLSKACDLTIEDNLAKRLYKNKKKSKRPKRNRSAFIIFSSEMRERLQSCFKNLNSNQIMIELSKLWKSLDLTQKQKYEALAQKDKERYLEEAKAFFDTHSIKFIQNRTKKNYIKKPCSAYAIYVKKMTKQIKSQNFGYKMAEILKIISEKWKGLSENEKKPYQEESIKEREMAKINTNAQAIHEKHKSQKKIKQSTGEKEKSKKYKEQNQRCQEIVFQSQVLVHDTTQDIRKQMCIQNMISPIESQKSKGSFLKIEESSTQEIESFFSNLEMDNSYFQPESSLLTYPLLNKDSDKKLDAHFDLLNFEVNCMPTLNLNLLGKLSEEIVNYNPFESMHLHMTSKSKALNQLIMDSLPKYQNDLLL